MDIGRVQPTGMGLEGNGVHSTATQPEFREDAASRRQLIQAVKAVNGSELFGSDSELTFVFDRHTQKALVRVINRRTREVMMQIPAEEVLRRARERDVSSI